MPTRLTSLKVDEGALVDRGDSPRAFFSFWKRRAPETGDGNMGDDKSKTSPNAEEVAKSALAELETVKKENGFMERMIMKLFGSNDSIDLAKSAEIVAPAVPAEFQKRLDDETAKRVDLEKRLADETEKRETREAVEKAQGFNLGMKTEDLAKALRLLRKALPEAEVQAVEQALTAASNQTKENDKLLQELGRAARTVDANEPEAQLDALVAKHATANSVTRAAAYAEVTKLGEGAALLQKIRKNEREADKAKG
jgi:hypothetical protein